MFSTIANIVIAYLAKLLNWQTTPIMPLQSPENTPSLVSPKERVYNVARALIGEKLTLDDSVPQDVRCAEAVSVVLSDCGYQIPSKGIPTVTKFVEWMVANPTLFRETKESSPGCIITANKADGSFSEYSHVGVIMKYGIASNDSRPEHLGYFLENYSSINHWLAYFNAHGSVTRYFEPI